MVLSEVFYVGGVPPPGPLDVGIGREPPRGPEPKSDHDPDRDKFLSFLLILAGCFFIILGGLTIEPRITILGILIFISGIGFMVYSVANEFLKKKSSQKDNI